MLIFSVYYKFKKINKNNSYFTQVGMQVYYQFHENLVYGLF